ncbi:MAG: HD domain-containing protein [Deltaproteobacteria bacterium]|nr:HD domain-containing protein [Deltaproteobacteria bacterium]
MISEKAFEIFSTYNSYGIALENHCIRLCKFALALAAKEYQEVDEDLLVAGANLHDIGLLVPNDDSPNYLYRGLAFALPLMDQWKLTDFEKRQMRHMLLYNHSLRLPFDITPAGDLLRRAVQVEHSLGKWSHGLDHQTIKNIFASWPRHGLNSVLVHFTRISLRRDGVSEIYRLFFPKGSDVDA